VTATKELAEGELEGFVDLVERLLELLARDVVDLLDRLLRVLDRVEQVFALRLEKPVALGRLFLLFERHHIDRAHCFQPFAHLAIERVFLRQRFAFHAGDGCVREQFFTRDP